MSTSTEIACGPDNPSIAHRDSTKRHSLRLHDRNDSPMSRKSELHRSASYTYLASGHESLLTYTPTNGGSQTTQPCFSEQDLTVEADIFHDASSLATSEEVSPSSDEQDGHTHKAPSPERPGEWPLALEETNAIPPSTPERVMVASRNPRHSFARRLSRKFTPRASRSPSPSKQPVDPSFTDPRPAEQSASPKSGSISRRRSLLRKRSDNRVDSTSADLSPIASPTRRTLHRTRSFIASTLSLDERHKNNNRPSIIEKSFSVDTLTHLADSKRHTLAGGPVPTLNLADYNTSFSSLSLAKKRDELWSVFRQLETDFIKFHAKSSSLKANVVRQCLLPFLRNYVKHPSNTLLRSEDLDRRTSILNKWWLGMLEMLNGKNNQSVSGTDRPAVLEAMSGIMERVEWRYLQPSSTLQKPQMVRAGRSSASLASTGSDPLMESVHNNVRTMFEHNLGAQMSFVVDKMSLRNASASLVTFCGKATAFAFFFCPQIAEVLVRAWNISSDSIKRILKEYDIGAFERIDEDLPPVRATFPPAVQNLGFTSLPMTMRHLRRPAQLPPGVSLAWYGHWLSRWQGKESDFFFVFAKNYYILAADFMPSETNKRAVICAPAMLLVQAQLLVTLDSTIHRAGNGASPGMDLSDDIIGEPDIAATLTMLPANAHRMMAENRLIMLTREVLHEKSSDNPLARALFAASFNDIMQASARRISVFDRAACYTLCDFLEEALLILVRYENLEPGRESVVATKFWYDVCKKMLASRDTTTEIRLFTFLFAIWNYVCPSGVRKLELCEELILDETVFYETFTHWCPMVRAYYMRLLCWRAARFDGEDNESSSAVLALLLERLRPVWSWYEHEKTTSSAGGRRFEIPTAPCEPAPGRRLIIVRTDSDVVRRGPSLGFDGTLTPRAARVTPPVTPYAATTMSQGSEYAPSSASSDGDVEIESIRGRDAGLRSFIRGMMGQSKKTSPARKGPSAVAVAAFAHPTGPGEAGATNGDGARDERRSPERSRPVQPVCFKFSLECSNRATPTGKGQGRPLECPRLPYLAQCHVEQRAGMDLKTAAGRPMPAERRHINVRYLGRAIAEWTGVVGECQSFIERRRADGVTDEKMIETPILGVEVCRR